MSVGIYAVKPWFRGRLAGATDALVRRNVSADTVTAAGIVAALCGGAAAVAGWWLAVPVFAFLRIAANALDGLVAQASGTARPAGELFNETADRIGDAAFFCGIATVGGAATPWALGALAAASVASFVGITARAAGGTRRYDGPMGKPDRMAVVSVAALVAVFSSTPDATVWSWACGIVVAGALLTAANRYRRAHVELSREA